MARAFNRMAAELRILYENLEAKVAERTRQLEAANEQTSYHLIQLATSAEVARVATSIRQLDSLLTTVVQQSAAPSSWTIHPSTSWTRTGSGPNQQLCPGSAVMPTDSCPGR